jgi:hypothetical protein
MAKGCVTARKRDWDGNPIGHASDNPILDTRSYIIDFDDGDQTELTANMIAESLLSWECWQHVGEMSAICLNVDEFGNFCVRVPTPKLP